MIGEEGEVDMSKMKVTSLVTKADESVIERYRDQLPAEVMNARWEDLTVWVDPLDGTKEYTEGYLDHVTVLVGIAIGKKAVGGVIHQPFWNFQSKEEDRQLGRTFYGVVGAGIGGNLTPSKPPEGERWITTTRSHSTGKTSLFCLGKRVRRLFQGCTKTP